MKVAFCIYGYSPDVERLQPWLTVHEVAKTLMVSGWDIHLITDTQERPSLSDIKHHYVKNMRPSNAHEMRDLLDNINPDLVVVLTTPLNLMVSGWYKFVKCKLVAFLSYPFYTRAELLRALPHLNQDDLVTYGRHAFVPKLLWSRILRKYFSAVVAQSNRTARRVAGAAGPIISAHNIQAGLDLGFWKPADTGLIRQAGVTRFLYVGSVKSVRGFNILLRAFRRLRDSNVELRILARGCELDELRLLRARISGYPDSFEDRVTIVGGWMDRESYRDELRRADVTVLPFVLVPSELPVSVLESIACGTPVITTDIDGLPEAVGEAGIIVRSASIRLMAGAMRHIATNPEKLSTLRKNCVVASAGMQNWDDVGQQWQQVLSS